jgi:DNA-binding response OmpR family regulator
MCQKYSPSVPPAATSPSGACGGNKPLVLIIEDNGSVRSLLCRTLTLAGYDVIEADGGHGGRKLLKVLAVEVVIVDLHLPDGDGIALMAEIRQLQAWLPLIAISGVIDEEIRIRLRDANLGCKVWGLAKPFAPEQLIDTVQEALAASRGRTA